MRLSLKSVRLFVVLATLAGSLFAFSPGASAHKNTGTVAAVNGIVEWPQGPKSPTFDLFNRSDNFGSGLSLDSRDATNSRLNGCRLEDGNSREGLPVGHTGKVTPPTPPELYTSHDLCFKFDGLQILSLGLWDGLNHETDFRCDASGTNGASGNDKGPAANVPASKLQGTDPPVNKPTFGAFYGEFTCDGFLVDSQIPDVQLPAVGTADGHFHGLSVGSTTIAFLGEVHCTTPNPANDPLTGVPNVCPKDNPANRTRFANGGRTSPRFPDGSPLDPKDHNESRIKHTIACKGEVVPWLAPVAGPFGEQPPYAKYPGVMAPPGDTIRSADVVLECVIG